MNGTPDFGVIAAALALRKKPMIQQPVAPSPATTPNPMNVIGAALAQTGKKAHPPTIRGIGG